MVPSELRPSFVLGATWGRCNSNNFLFCVFVHLILIEACRALLSPGYLLISRVSSSVLPSVLLLLLLCCLVASEFVVWHLLIYLCVRFTSCRMIVDVEHLINSLGVRAACRYLPCSYLVYIACAIGNLLEQFHYNLSTSDYLHFFISVLRTNYLWLRASGAAFSWSSTLFVARVFVANVFKVYIYVGISFSCFWFFWCCC